MEFRILYVKGLYSFMKEIDVLYIIQLLQYKVRRIIEQAGPRVIVYFFEEHFVGGTIEQIFARMDFIANIHTAFIEIIQDGQPSFPKLPDPFFHQTCRSLRPGVKRMP